MEPTSPIHRVEAALAATETEDALLELVRDLRDGGMSRSELRALFDAARERHSRDSDATLHDAILDAMDLIVGRCDPSQALDPDPPG